MATRFADTTALFEHAAGTRQSRSEARRELGPPENVVTSEAVEREWKRIIFHSVKDVLEALERQESLGAALRELGSGFGRRPSQRLLALAMLVGPDDDIDLTVLRVRASQLLRSDAEARLRRMVGGIRRASECGLALARIRLRGSEWELKWTCRRREGICVHENRVENQMTRWDAGADALTRSGDDALCRMGRKAREMSRDPHLRTGKNCYLRTGDLAIAMDCRPGEVLVTTDHSFGVLAHAMGFTVKRITAAA